MASDAALPRPASRTAPAPDIVFVTRKWAPATGGMETYCHRLTEALLAHEPVEVIALPGRADGMPPGLLALLAFPFTVLARWLTRGAAPRVLHLADMATWPLALPALLWSGTRIVLSAHGTDVSYGRRGGICGSLYGGYMRLGARLLRGARIIANSQATKAVAEEAGWRGIAVVPLATELSGPQPDGTHDGSILFAGRLIKHKGCAWFVREVLPLLPGHVRLKVAGTVWDPAEAKILDHPRVDFLGVLSQGELAHVYARAVCVIVPNIELASGEHEGFGLVAPEAAAAGGVVLAADHGGLRDAVIDSVTGFLVRTGDPEAWAAAVDRVARWTQAQRADFVTRSQSRAREQFSWARVARQTLSVYGLEKRG